MAERFSGIACRWIMDKEYPIKLNVRNVAYDIKIIVNIKPLELSNQCGKIYIT